VKKTDIEKSKALKLVNDLKLTSARRGPTDNAPKPDRREQRRLDQQHGLVPFACKLNDKLVERLKARAASHPGGLNAVVGELLTQALEQSAV
jgi:hypothetical protein